MNRKQITIASAVFALLLVGIAVWYWSTGPDREVAKLKEMQASVFGAEARKLPEEERRKRMSEYRQQYEQLSEAQRRELRKDMFRGMQQRSSAKIHEYFELPLSQRRTFLDKQIREMESRRKQFASRGDRGSRPTGKGGGRGGPGRGGGERGKMTETEKQDRRDRFKRGHLDGTTPQQRAEMSEYMEAIRKRREELGLPEMRGRRGGPRRFQSFA